jgi:prepilin-type N-terminal cleavage/methylation domain-containing protein
MKKGFTLVEMLAVIGIIAILSAAAIGSLGYATKKAQLAKGRELVSNVATALAVIYQEDGRWPAALVSANGKDEYRLGKVPGAVLARKGVLSLSYQKNESGQYVLSGLDKFGVADPWAQAAIKGRASASEGTRVASGGTVNDHIIRFAIDDEGTGITQATVCGKTIRVRAPAIAWSTGPDGKFDSLDNMGRSDDIFSFREGQIVK